MEKEKSPQSIAKVVLTSSLLTVVIILATTFASRDFLVGYLIDKVEKSQSVEQQVSEEMVEPIIEAVSRVNPAVVSVVVTKDVPIYEQYYEAFNPGGPFGGVSIPRVRKNGTQEREVGGGSGFIVTQDGMIVTNHHVVADEAARYSVLMNDGTVYGTDILARDAELDIAILKISEPLKSPLTVVHFGASDELQLGQTVIAIGNALAEFQNSVSVGVVSGLSRSIAASDGFGKIEHLDQVIQTDAAINPGNSGGPLLNLAGEVVGVNVATSRGADNIGFAIPAQVVKQVVDSVREYGEIVRPYIGVRYTMITPRIAKANNLSVEYGALVVRGDLITDIAVVPESPADTAGLSEGDIILSVDGVELRDIELSTVLRKKVIGQEVSLEILHEDEQKTVSVTLERAL